MWEFAVDDVLDKLVGRTVATNMTYMGISNCGHLEAKQARRPRRLAINLCTCDTSPPLPRADQPQHTGGSARGSARGCKRPELHFLDRMPVFCSRL